MNVAVIIATFTCANASKSSLKLEMPSHTFKAPLNYGMLLVLFFNRLIRQRTGGMDGLGCIDLSRQRGSDRAIGSEPNRLLFVCLFACVRRSMFFV